MCLLVRGRAQLSRDFPGDAALLMTRLQSNDTGRYRCEVVDGLEDKSASIDLELRGTVGRQNSPSGQKQKKRPVWQHWGQYVHTVSILETDCLTQHRETQNDHKRLGRCSCFVSLSVRGPRIIRMGGLVPVRSQGPILT